MIAYYNENDPKAAAWLRELINAGLIAQGVVDERSIEDVRPTDLAGFTQCHFFAGIGGWSYALRLAAWPDGRPVWTGSCPCQPFSAAGKGGGFTDERHLWPAWFHLIEKCGPSVVFGEQVASKDGLAWFDLVSNDLENANYAIGAADICAAGVGAPHIRQRLFFVANAASRNTGTERQQRSGQYGLQPESNSMEHPEGDGRVEWWTEPNGRGAFSGCGEGRVGDAAGVRLDGLHAGPSEVNGVISGESDPRKERGTAVKSSRASTTYWDAVEWLPCIDGKSRPVEPGTFPLAHGIPDRVGLLRGYGNAIVPQVAQAFIEAYMSLRNAV